MTTNTRKKKSVAKPLYQGATTCDFVPEYSLDGDGLALCQAVFAAKIGDYTPMLVLADWLEDREDRRHEWVRFAVELECFATNLGATAAGNDWHDEDRRSAFAELTNSEPGWRAIGLYGVMCSRWSPSGIGKPSWHTWSDVRIDAVERGIWFWACGLSKTKSQAYAAGHQAYAAWHQADAAWRQAYAAGHQAYAAGHQAYAAGHQADAAGRQADAAGRQADAAQNICFQWQRSLLEKLADMPWKKLETRTQ